MNIVYLQHPQPRHIDIKLSKLLNKCFKKNTKNNFEVIKDYTTNCDILFTRGWKKQTYSLMDNIRNNNQHLVLFEKGHFRSSSYWRISIDDYQPLNYFQNINQPDDRWEELKIEFNDFQFKQNENILYAVPPNHY